MIELPPELQSEINRLAADLNDAQERMLAIGMMNANVPYEQRLKQSQEYAIAQATVLNADARLKEAFARAASIRSPKE